MKVLPSRRVLCTPYNHAPCHFMQSYIRRVHVGVAETRLLHLEREGGRGEREFSLPTSRCRERERERETTSLHTTSLCRVCVWVCGVCVWVCEGEREREGETDRQTDRERQRQTERWQKTCLYWSGNVFRSLPYPKELQSESYRGPYNYRECQEKPTKKKKKKTDTVCSTCTFNTYKKSIKRSKRHSQSPCCHIPLWPCLKTAPFARVRGTLQ